MSEQINRPQCKEESRRILRSAEVPPKAFALIYLLLVQVLDLIADLAGVEGVLSLFASVLDWMLISVLAAGFTLYCMDIRRGVRAGYLTLFDGFSFAGKLVGESIVQIIFIGLWSMLFVIPGVVAAYRYRFAVYNLCENPDLGILEALNMSKQQTWGYKGQLFMLDLSYLGWTILLNLPAAIYDSMQIASMDTYGIGIFTGADAPLDALPATPLYVTILLGVWAVVVQVFYLPHYQCTELAYYEAAKRTSGINPVRSKPGDWIDTDWRDSNS